MEKSEVSNGISVKGFVYHLPKPWTNLFSSEMVSDPVLVAPVSHKTNYCDLLF